MEADAMALFARDQWIEEFSSRTHLLDAGTTPSSTAEVAKHLWYSCREESAAEVATRWHDRTLPADIQRDAWISACCRCLQLFERALPQARVERLARQFFDLDELGAKDPYAVAEAWAMDRRSPESIYS
jgi:hypothetical protein